MATFDIYKYWTVGRYMRFDIDKVLGIHQQAMLVRGQRAEILAGNLANVDTPNYKARDINFRQILSHAVQEAAASRLRTTHPRHISGMLQASGNNFELLYREPLQPAVDGNTVDGQVEKAEFTRNAMQYQASLQLLTGRIKSILTAIRGE